MNTKEQIQQKIQDLKEALKMNYISVNEYCSMYLALSQKLAKLN